MTADAFLRRETSRLKKKTAVIDRRYNINQTRFASRPFKVLHRFLVLLRRGSRLERPQISPFPRLGILPPRIQPIFPRL
jgi:hypothetical protein